VRSKQTKRSTVLFFVIHKRSKAFTPEAAADHAYRSVVAERKKRGWDSDPAETSRRALIWQAE